ncbi:hypothetical protein MKX07_000509 [Trichoderma sp. CBMAI-0711]|nr:hypothetical protein MKX07_000509 [Trichoderma sp. CBMAI-0711]
MPKVTAMGMASSAALTRTRIVIAAVRTRRGSKRTREATEQTKDVTSVFAAAAAEVQQASVVERDPNGFVKPLDIGMEG